MTKLKINTSLVLDGIETYDKSPLDIFTILSNQHHLDILKTAGNIFPRFFYPNIECTYTQHLFAIMLLKASNLFDISGKLENVKNITEGPQSDPNFCGIAFTFNGVDYEFANSIKNHERKRIPHDEPQVDVLKLMHKMDLPYSMLYKLDNELGVLR